MARRGEVAGAHRADDRPSLGERREDRGLVGGKLLRGEPQLRGAVGHERPARHAEIDVPALLAERRHSRGVEVLPAGEVDVDHGEAGRPAAVLLDGAAGVGLGSPRGVRLVQVGHRTLLPFGDGRALQRDGVGGGAAARHRGGEPGRREDESEQRQRQGSRSRRNPPATTREDGSASRAPRAVPSRTPRVAAVHKKLLTLRFPLRSGPYRNAAFRFPARALNFPYVSFRFP